MRPVHILLAAIAVAAPARAAGPGAAAPRSRYLGAEACAACHPEIAGSWRRGAHARAAAPEVLGARSRDPRCLACHATGDGAAVRGRLPGVQCEACHGPGEAYATADVMRDPFLARLVGLRRIGDAAALCRRCHRDRPPSSPGPHL